MLKKYFMEAIIEKIKNGEGLTPVEQLIMFCAPERVELLEMYLFDGYSLCDMAQFVLFKMPERVELFKLYVVQNNNYLCNCAELKMLDMPERSELLEMYRSQGFELCDEAQEKARELGLI